MYHLKALFLASVILPLTTYAYIGGYSHGNGLPTKVRDLAAATVALRILTLDGRVGGCAGVAIDRYAFLTAAHCVIESYGVLDQRVKIQALRIQSIVSSKWSARHAPSALGGDMQIYGFGPELDLALVVTDNPLYELSSNSCLPHIPSQQIIYDASSLIQKVMRQNVALDYLPISEGGGVNYLSNLAFGQPLVYKFEINLELYAIGADEKGFNWATTTNSDDNQGVFIASGFSNHNYPTHDVFIFPPNHGYGIQAELGDSGSPLFTCASGKSARCFLSAIITGGEVEIIPVGHKRTYERTISTTAAPIFIDKFIDKPLPLADSKLADLQAIVEDDDSAIAPIPNDNNPDNNPFNF